MIIDVAKMDRYLLLLHAEVKRLRMLGQGWANEKADQFDELAELVRQLRQARVMRGPDGVRIE
jgi:hypothetical protein